MEVVQDEKQHNGLDDIPFKLHDFVDVNLGVSGGFHGLILGASIRGDTINDLYFDVLCQIEEDIGGHMPIYSIVIPDIPYELITKVEE